jgi:type I restriction enzyme M protein
LVLGSRSVATTPVRQIEQDGGVAAFELLIDAPEHDRLPLERVRRAAWESANILRSAGLNLLDALDHISFFLFLGMLETDGDGDGEGPLADLAQAIGFPPLRRCLESPSPVVDFERWVLPAVREAIAGSFADSVYSQLIAGFVPKIEDEAAFRDFVGLIESMSLDARQCDANGAIYERIVASLAQAGHLGQFFTPQHVVDLVIDLVAPAPGEHVHDPAAGTGGFLIATGARMRRLGQEARVSGRELDPLVRRLCLINLLMHGHDPNLIEGGDSLAPVAQRARPFDVIVTNPPFAAMAAGRARLAGFPVMTNSVEALFLQHVTRVLAPGGRAAVICPEGLLANLGTDRDVRRHVLGTTSVEAVVSLPSGVFNPYTAVRTGIVLLRNVGRSSASTWMFDVRSDGFGLNARRRSTGDSDFPAVVAGYQGKLETPQSRAVPYEELSTQDFRLVASRYVRVSTRRSSHPVRPLGELAQQRKESVNPAALGAESVICLGLEHVASQTGSVTKPAPAPAHTLKSMKVLFHAGDILYGKLRPYLAKAALADFSAIGTTEFVVLEVVDEGVEPDYLARVLRSPEFTEAATSLMVGANHPRIHPKDLLGISIPVPPIELQRSLTKRAAAMQSRAHAAREKAEDLERQANAILCAIWSEQSNAD